MHLSSIPSKEVLIPLVTGLIGYVSAALQSIGTLRRERHKALNGVLYSLLEIRWEIRASDPALMQETLRRMISKRLGEGSAPILETPEAQRLIGQLLDIRIPLLKKERLATRYAEAVKATVPFCPLIAHRLAGMDVVSLDQSLRSYYEGIRRHPALALDPNVPASITRLESRTIEQGFTEAQLKLTKDVRRIAWRLGPATWVKAHFALRRQDRRLSPDEFCDSLNQILRGGCGFSGRSVSGNLPVQYSNRRTQIHEKTQTKPLSVVQGTSGPGGNPG